MAKWGEGDPRWIVEERPDATNVNNWHWTEKNAGPWSQDKLKELFNDLIIGNVNVAHLKINNIDKIFGEASANNRKGKLIFFYEWEITLKWEGKVNNDNELVEGTAVIPNLSEENDVSEIEVRIDVEKETKNSEILKDIMFTRGKEVIHEKLATYIKLLKEEFSQGMILPSKDELDNINKEINNLTCGFNRKTQMNNQTTIKASKQTAPVASNIETEKLTLTEKLQCMGQDVYNAFTDNNMIQIWTMGALNNCVAKEGEEFSLFRGNITGKFLTLTPPTKIIQLWRYSQWPQGHYSTVTINIEQKDDHTVVNLTQEGIPKNELDVTKSNWGRYYFDSMKRSFCWGAFFDCT